jgi:hypothetical protein
MKKSLSSDTLSNEEIRCGVVDIAEKVRESKAEMDI